MNGFLTGGGVALERMAWTDERIDDARKRLTHKDDVERPKEKPPAAA
jgi:hypothetical protein